MPKASNVCSNRFCCELRALVLTRLVYLCRYGSPDTSTREFKRSAKEFKRSAKEFKRSVKEFKRSAKEFERLAKVVILYSKLAFSHS